MALILQPITKGLLLLVFKIGQSLNVYSNIKNTQKVILD